MEIDLLDETIALYKLSNYIRTLLDENKFKDKKGMIETLYCEIGNAMHFLSLYDNVTDNDSLREDLELSFYDSLGKVKTNIEFLGQNGINLYIH